MSELSLHLHRRQGEAFLSRATEMLYGGAAGGGKSHLMRVASIIWATEIAGLQVYLFRRIRDDLIKNHLEGPSGYYSLLSPWVADGRVEIVGDEIRFWNGSKIYLCHCKDEKHRFKYQGAEIHVLLIDELTHFSEKIYRFLRGRVRMVGLTLPEKYLGLFPRIINGSNPGNEGHLWVKRTFIDNKKEMDIYQAEITEGSMDRQYIPARLDDNPSMLEDDPTYELKLEGLGSKALVQAMRWGDWDIIDGAFFDNWDRKKHVIKPFSIPSDWMRFRSGDWGSAKPFSFGWWAVVTSDYKLQSGQILPRGCMVRYREWYGCKDGVPDTGLKLTSEQVADGIKEREIGDELAYGVLDPAAFSNDGGPSHAERMYKHAKVRFRRADNKRVPRRGAMGGWDAMRHRLNGDEDEQPMIVCFDTCLDSIRTIPALQHDEDKPEDLNTKMEDHAADEWRYACMSRPFTPAIKEPKKAATEEYTADPITGQLNVNMSVKDIIAAKARERALNE